MNTISCRPLPDGVFPVALTPFKSDGSIDFAAYEKLINWYIDQGSAGIFAVCMSSELFELSAPEKLDLVRHAVDAAAGRVPVVAGAGFGDTLAAKRTSVRTVAAAGVDAVVIPASLLGRSEDDESVIIDNFMRLVEAKPEIRYGLYECPAPYHRLISPDGIAVLAARAGSRLAFIKDTCCNFTLIRNKLAALSGSGVKLYNANTATLLASLEAGAAGYCGTSANYFPALLVELVACFHSDPLRARKLQAVCDLLQHHVDYKYPAAAKRFLSFEGVAMTDFCRVAMTAKLLPEDTAELLNLRNFITDWKRQLIRDKTDSFVTTELKEA